MAIAGKSAIEWTEMTWNPVTGCDKVSPGCKHCYAERFSLRLQAMGKKKYRDGFNILLHRNVLSDPLTWKKSRMIFVNSMSDLFHEKVPTDFIIEVFRMMNRCTQHTFQVLTKRAERLHHLADRKLLFWSDNIWIGVSVEDQERAEERIPKLLTIPAAVRFLSVEPLLGPIQLPWLNNKNALFVKPEVREDTGETVVPPLDAMIKMEHRPCIHWLIVGGESGPAARPCKAEWVRSIRDQCIEAGVPFFFKQWGGVNRKKTGRILDGRTWDEIPGGPNNELRKQNERVR